MARHCSGDIEIIWTINVPEPLPKTSLDYKFPLRFIHNTQPKGFGANHNAAFQEAHGDIFCVINPDIRLTADPFPALLRCLETPQSGVVAPLVMNSNGQIADNARRFPTPWRILQRLLPGQRPLDYPIQENDIAADWVAGMFMLFPSDIYRELGGFDQRYFLYYEDADLCSRLRDTGRTVILCTHTHVIHHAQRQSHRNLKYLRWHIASMLRFFYSQCTWGRPGIHHRNES